MQGRYTDAIKTTRDGKINPCRWMDIQKPGRFPPALHTSGKARKGYHTLSSGKRPSQKDGEFHPQAGGVKITSACLP